VGVTGAESVHFKVQTLVTSGHGSGLHHMILTAQVAPGTLNTGQAAGHSLAHPGTGGQGTVVSVVAPGQGWTGVGGGLAARGHVHVVGVHGELCQGGLLLVHILPVSSLADPGQSLVDADCVVLTVRGLGDVELYGDLARALLGDHVRLVAVVHHVVVTVAHVRVIDGVGAPGAVAGDAC